MIILKNSEQIKPKCGVLSYVFPLVRLFLNNKTQGMGVLEIHNPIKVHIIMKCEEIIPLGCII